MSKNMVLSNSLFLLAALAIAPGLYAGPILQTPLTGANEVPPTGSAATGFITVTLNGDSLTVDESFTGLSIAASAAHIHCCAPIGTNTIVAVPFPSFPNATSGTYNQIFDLTLLATYNGAFVTANGGTAASAESALIAGLLAGQAYANIHNTNFPGGEIRGQLAVTPEPATAVTPLLAGAAMFLLRRRIISSRR